MPSQRDFDQMLKSALEMKALSQKFIDFAKMYGAGDGGEGEEDLEELPEDDNVEEDKGEGEMADSPSTSGRKGPMAAILIAMKKKKK